MSSEVLVRAFGWDTADLFTQQDAQELSRLLCDKLEEVVDASATTSYSNMVDAQTVEI